MNQPVAAIDLGTNTARLLIARPERGEGFVPVLLKRNITRLGGGFTNESGISSEAMERALSAMVDFAREMKAHNVGKVRAVATSAVRDAVNGKDFCDHIFHQTGILPEIIDGTDEGLLTLRGVLTGLDDRTGNFLVFDVGGGSTEYTVASGDRPLLTRSLPLGVVRLTEGKKVPEAMEAKIGTELAMLREELETMRMIPLPAPSTLIGTAGTITTLAAVSLKMTDYDYRKVNNHILGIDEIARIYDVLLPLSPAERLQVPGLEPGREDLIIAGILITLKTMQMFDFTSIKVSDFGLLEGLLASLLD